MRCDRETVGNHRRFRSHIDALATHERAFPVCTLAACGQGTGTDRRNGLAYWMTCARGHRALSEALANEPTGAVISVDTFYASVAAAAVEAGAGIVNDVSGGTLDDKMWATVASLNSPVPYVMMHMRGDPTTMMKKEHARYDDVCVEVGSALRHQVRTSSQFASVMSYVLRSSSNMDPQPAKPRHHGVPPSVCRAVWPAPLITSFTAALCMSFVVAAALAFFCDRFAWNMCVCV